MPETIEGATDSENKGKSSREELASIAARVKAEEAKMTSSQLDPMAVTAATPGPQQIVPPMQDDKAPPSKMDDVPLKFRGKDGQVSEDKILKANEHLEKAIPEKEERLKELLRRHKDLEQKFTRTSQEVRRVEKEVPIDQAPAQPVEFRKKFLEDLEKDPVSAIERLVDVKSQAIRERLEQSELKTRALEQAEELDSLVRNGNEWIYTEGLGRFEQVFQERPYLRNSPTPYLDAVRFMEPQSPKGAANGSAQPIRTTPILGAGSATPPPSSEPPESKEQAMQKLSEKWKLAAQHGDKKTMSQIMVAMDKLERGY